MPIAPERATERIAQLTRSNQLVGQGRHGEAMPLLLELLGGDDTRRDGVSVEGLVLLARCFREDGRFDDARGCARAALNVARSLDYVSGAAKALEALARIDEVDGRIASAADYFFQSAELEKNSGNAVGAGAALSNYGHVLSDNNLEGGERLLRQAIALLPVGTDAYGAATDNLSSELARQGRWGESVKWAEASIATFRALGDAYNLYVALMNLAEKLRLADRLEEGARAFVEAHDLIHGLRMQGVDRDHYTAYAQRVAEIEARIESSAGDDPEAARRAGLAWQRAGQEFAEGVTSLEGGGYADAVQHLARARQLWAELGATHMLLHADFNLASAYCEVGDTEAALRILHGVRAAARGLGDAYSEILALSQLARLSLERSGHESLDLLAQLRALAPIAQAQLGDTVSGFSDGTEDAQEANICARAGAIDLADGYFRTSIAAARAMSDQRRFRLVYRLWNYYLMLAQAQRLDRARDVLADLERAGAGSSDPRVQLVAARASTRHAYEQHDFSEETLRGLLAECAAYESIRRQSEGVEDLGGLAGTILPPFSAAAEVAIALERPKLALAILERSKARTLLDELLVKTPELPDLDSGDPPPPAISDAVGLEIFMTESRLWVLVLDGRTADVRVEPVAEGADVVTLTGALGQLTAAADAERAQHRVQEALDAVLAAPAFRALQGVLQAAVGPGRRAWLAPHRQLHQAPLHLPSAAEPTPSVPFSVVPSLLTVQALPASGTSGRRVVCGDSLGNLPFARLEARMVAHCDGGGDGDGDVAVGRDCTWTWLQRAVAPGVGVLHIACHGRFDGRHPDRSGLVLASEETDVLPGTTSATLITAEQIASLPLRGTVVVLSACSSGLEAVREGDEFTGVVSAMLRAGAAAVVAARWPVADSSAMLFMTDFHRRLLAGPPPADLLRLLAETAGHVRTLTTDDVIAAAFDLADQAQARGGTADEALAVATGLLRDALRAADDQATLELLDMTEKTSGAGAQRATERLAALRKLVPAGGTRPATNPYGHPSHWGAFALVGRTEGPAAAPDPTEEVPA